MIESGQQFGLYVIKDVITSCENQVCYCAEDPFFNREVSLKLYPVDQLAEQEQQLTELEAQLERLAVLDHPSIAPIYDSGTEDGYFYYTSALYSSESLDQQLKSHPFNDDAALKATLELTQALEYAAQQGFFLNPAETDGVTFDDGGRAVFTNLGIDELYASLQRGEVAKPLTVPEVLQNIGGMLLQMLLGPAYSSAEPLETLIGKVSNARIQSLLERFLLPDAWRFETFSELLEELRCFEALDDQLSAAEVQPELINNEASEAAAEEQTEKMIADVRQLVAEKNTLQQSLDAALYERSQAKKQQNEGEKQLILARREVARAKEEANVAWELVAGQKYDRWRPVVWAVGGFVIGFLLSGSYGYYYSEQTREELLAKLKENEELIKTAAWRPAEKTEQSKGIQGEVAVTPKVVEHVQVVEEAVESQQVVPNAPELTFEELVAVAQNQPVVPVAEETQSWWPAGAEFSAAAAIPIEQIKVALGLEGRSLQDSLPDIVRQEVIATVQQWAESWSQQDLTGYFSYYSESYRPELGRSQQEWREMRRSRLTKPQWIKLNVDDIKVRQISEDRIQVKLKQNYRSDFYQDEILKSINLIKEDGQWRILMERSLGMVDGRISDIVGG